MAVPVLERAGQITSVVDAVARARTSAGSLLLVAGEAGVGKTTLVRAALDELPARVGRWWGACDPLATPRPLGPWEDMAVREPALASVLHDTDRIAMGAGVLELLREPTVVVVEDVHWVDEASVDLLLFLGRRLERCRSVLVVTYRPVDVTTDHPASRLLGLLARSPEARLLRVDPLSQDAVAQLADGSGLDPAELHRHTGGNPFYLTEVLAEPARTVPGTVADAVRARVADLPLAGRRLLDLVALTPAGLEYAIASDLLGEDAAASGLDQAAARDMANLVGDRVVFRHELARLAVAEAVPPGRRRQLHARLLATLEDLPGVDPARLVHHAAHAQDRERILVHAPAAAELAAARGAYRAAAAHLERALAVADGLSPRDQAELWERLADQREHFDSRIHSIALRRQVAERWHAVGDVDLEVAQLSFLAGDHNATGDRAGAERALAQASALLPDVTAAWVPITVRMRRLRLDDSQRPLTEQLAGWEQLATDVERLDPREWPRGVRSDWRSHAISVAWESAACIHASLGHVDPALRLVDRCADLARRAVPWRIGVPECNVGEALLESRHHEHARRLLEKSAQTSRGRDDDQRVAYATAVLARLHLERGHWVEARTAATPVAESDDVGPVIRALALTVAARLDAHAGVADATARLRAAWEAVRGSGDRDWLWPVAVASAEDAWLRGHPEEAIEVVIPALNVALDTQHPWAVGELTWWARQAGHDVPVEIEVAEPWAAALAGDWIAAADAWDARGCPLDQAIALMAGDVAAQRRALDLFIELGAGADADRLRQSLRAAGEIDLPARDRPRAAPASVTARQLEVLELVAAGLTNADIADRLYISEKTVGHHVSAILQRLDVRTRTHAVTVARQRGLLPD